MRGLTSQSAADLKFLLNGRDGKEDRMISIVDYFKEIYNVQVTKPRLVGLIQNGNFLYLQLMSQPCVAFGQRNYIPYVKLFSIAPL